MNDKIRTYLGSHLSQSQAAALAVLASNVRDSMQDLLDKSTMNCPESNAQVVYDFWQEIENLAIDSIKVNDGEVVKWIGVAAKQMNPLLA